MSKIKVNNPIRPKNFEISSKIKVTKIEIAINL